MRRRVITVSIGFLVALALAGGAWTALRGRVSTPDRALEVSGRIEGDEIIVSSKVAGRAQDLLVREGDQVRAGQLLAVLSSDELDARMRQADAQVPAAAAQELQARRALDVFERQYALARKSWEVGHVRAPIAVDEGSAALRAAEAELVRAQALREEAFRDLARLRSLLDAGAVARAQVDAAETRAAMSSAQVAAAAEQVVRARAALAAARTSFLEVEAQAENVRAVQGQLDAARAALATVQAQKQAVVAGRDELHALHQEVRVTAPAAGIVVARVVNAGEVVQAGTPLLVTVDLDRLWLKVFVPSPDIARLRLGMPADVFVDAFPATPFAGRIVEISQRAEFTPKDVQTREERVKQVVAVKIAVQNTRQALKPGMPADARIVLSDEAPR